MSYQIASFIIRLHGRKKKTLTESDLYKSQRYIFYNLLIVVYVRIKKKCYFSYVL